MEGKEKEMMEALFSAAKFFTLPPALLMALCSTESDFRSVVNRHDGGSPSYGICQIKYGTAKMLGYAGKPNSLVEPGLSAFYGAKYLNRQFTRNRMNVCDAISAYNAGRPLVNKKGQYKNSKYVRRVLRRWRKYERSSDRRESLLQAKGSSTRYISRTARICQQRSRNVQSFKGLSGKPGN